ncbi:hypothetical protein NLI96_g11347 [Meripilus lineatus]|uniref:Tricarboxylate transport protein n=1 Tax=Meripilus lineatus TaxID=2056292 RepID=A0AAD5US13_9APHY|nr:hypothetical protein NLI96_g11347 [Physisporinus lineatus]
MSKKEKPLHSLVAGTTAGAIEAFLTYPTEFVKTRSQFGGQKESPITIIRSTLATKGITGLYSGCTALIIGTLITSYIQRLPQSSSVLIQGNAAKAGVRFVSYDHFKSLLADEQGKVTAAKSLLAGLGAGTMEALFAVTPSETIKYAASPLRLYLVIECGTTSRTKLIDDAKSPNPRFRGLVHGTACIVREEGITGIYRGLFPVMMRQGANSAVRFTTYTTLKQFVQSNARPGQQLPSSITFGIGAIAGLVTVYTTMPFEIFTEEGVLRFWTGTTPRLVRLMLSGGIVFTIYENVIRVIGDKKDE